MTRRRPHAIPTTPGTPCHPLTIDGDDLDALCAAMDAHVTTVRDAAEAEYRRRLFTAAADAFERGWAAYLAETPAPANDEASHTHE